MKRALIIFAIIILGATGIYFISNSGDTDETETAVAGDQTSKPVYQKITPQKAKEIMDGEQPYILLDVRTEEEFDETRIPGAILIPNDEIIDRVETELPDKNAVILVYCRSGGRSAKAANKLIEMEYTNVYDIGGIIDWPYETISEQKDE